MPQAFARADLLVCRSGASTVAEIAAAGKPAVFIPFPRAADDHQRRNAEAIANAGAAVLLDESAPTPEFPAKTLAGMFRDPMPLAGIGGKTRSRAHRDAEGKVAGTKEGLATHLQL